MSLIYDDFALGMKSTSLDAFSAFPDGFVNGFGFLDDVQNGNFRWRTTASEYAT